MLVNIVTAKSVIIFNQVSINNNNNNGVLIFIFLSHHSKDLFG